MKKKLMIIVPILVLIIVLVLVVLKANKSKKEQQEIIDNVNKYYDILKEETTKINELRKEYSSLISGIYYSELNEKKDDILKELDDYTNLKEETITKTNALKSLCKKALDTDSTKKCKTYTQTIESLEKYYEDDVKVYNDLVDKYNENGEEKIEKYNSESSEYE